MPALPRKPKIIFMGTPEFAAVALRQIVATGAEVAAVYTREAKPKGRGMQLSKTPVHEVAEQFNIPVYTPKSFKKDAEAVAEFCALAADVAIVAAYGLILPKAVLEAPRLGCINIHASLLPRWRGASPIQRAIWAGDSMSGVTLMQMDEGLDTGDMIVKDSVEISAAMGCEQLHDKLADMGGRLVVEWLQQIEQGSAFNAEKQQEDKTCYAPLLKKEDGLINWQQKAVEIDRQVRALNPWPATYTHVNGKVLRIQKAVLLDGAHHAATGQVLNKDGDIACGQGSILRILEVKPENSKAMGFKDALNGKHFNIGDVFT